MLEIGQQAPLLVVGDQRQARADEASSAHAEPAAAYFEPLSIGQLETVELERNAVRSRGCRLEDLCHGNPKLP
ncbi:MAG: hypothetical protein JO325_11450 [Solirubrobacterales bacterium]|nr:hypothetical protein [Solirubrobacterales bacterium]